MTQLESLANELLLDLFEFCDAAHLLQAFFGLNSRFNALLRCHFQTHQLNLQSLSKEDFDRVSRSFLPPIIDQITSLGLSAEETPYLPELLLTNGFTFDRFIHLRNLLLSNVYQSGTLSKIIHQCQHLPHLTYLSIVKNDDDNERQENLASLLNKIWSLANLQYCNLNGLQADEESLTSISNESSSMKYLSIKRSPCNLNCLSHIFKLTPNLQQLCATVYSYLRDDRLTCTIPSLNSAQLIFGGSFDSMSNLLKSMPNLSDLMITALQVYFDGNSWEQLIRTYLLKLEKFQLKMELEFHDNYSVIEDTIESLIDSFRTQFWLEERQWYVRCHWNPSDPYKWVTLYTLPYSFDTFDYSNKSCTKSTCPNDGLYWAYDSVKTFGHGSVENTLLDSFSLIRARFRNVVHLQTSLSFDDAFWQRFPSLDYLKSLHVFVYRLASYLQLQILFDRAPCLYSLKVQCFTGTSSKIFKLTSNSIRRVELVDSFFNQVIYYDTDDCSVIINSKLGKQCEVLSIRIQDRWILLNFIRNMPNLRSLIVECQDDVEFVRKPSSKNELVHWLNARLPSTFTINRQLTKLNFVQIWIDRDTTKQQTLDDFLWKSKPKSRVRQVFTSFRKYFNQSLNG